MPNFRPPSSEKGFTGIELLIVLTVVAIVALLVANNIQEALAKGRDIERRSEINAIRDKLEEYWHANESYPADFTPLNLSADTLTDPGGNLILISPASDSANKPASSYAQTSSRPTQEYTYAPYDCGPRPAATGDETAQAIDEPATASEGCRSYVLYSWLEKAEIGEIPYEVNNQHGSP